MPTGISHTVINPTTLSRPNAPDAAQSEQRARQAAGAVETGESNITLSGPGDQLIRAPEPEAGSQGASNQQPAASATAPGTGGSKPAGNPAVSQPVPSAGLQAQVANGLGGNVDIIG